jgi:arylsulfatase A-like enzyme
LGVVATVPFIARWIGFVRVAMFVAVLTLPHSSCRSSPEPPRNVILVTIDTLRADHVGAYGYPRPTTPFLDDLAGRGVLFENAFSSSSHTAPSHATMFTSVYPQAHGVLENGTALPEDLDTLAETLRDNGYQTAAFTSVRFLELLGRGFEHFDADRRLGGGTVTAARGWLASDRDADRPLFLWVHVYDVHQYEIRDAGDTGFLEKMRQRFEAPPRALPGLPGPGPPDGTARRAAPGSPPSLRRLARVCRRSVGAALRVDRGE